jgi:hypothetical protein
MNAVVPGCGRSHTHAPAACHLGAFEKKPRKTEDDQPAAVAFDGTFGEVRITTNIERARTK